MPETTRTNWILIAAIFIAGLFAAAQFGKLTLTIELVQEAYPDVRDWVPSLVSVVGVVGMIFGVFAGPFGARQGLARVLLISLVMGACMSLIQALLPPIGVFAATRIIEGFSQLGIVISGPTLIAVACRDADRPFAMGIWAAFFGASFAVTAAILPSLLAIGGLPFMFLCHGIGMLVIAGILAKLLPNVAPETTITPSFTEAYRRLYSTPNLLLPGAGFVWYTALYIALIAVLPIALDLSIRTVAIIPLVSIVGTIGAGVVARYVGPHHLSNAGFVASAVFMIIILIGWDQTWVIYMLFMLMGAIPTGAFAAISYFNQTTETRASATGGVTHFGNIGTTVGTPIMVLCYQWAGLGGVTAMVVVCCLGGLASITGLVRIKT